MINPERENAIKIDKLYKENNKETEEVISEWIPEKRMFVYTKVKTDPNAVNMQQYIKTGREKKIKEKPKKKKLSKVRIQKPKKATVVPKSNYKKIYSDYKIGLSYAELGDKYFSTIRAIKFALSNHRINIGEKEAVIIGETAKKIQHLLTLGFSRVEIAEKLGRKQNTISYHICKLKRSSNENK